MRRTGKRKLTIEHNILTRRLIEIQLKFERFVYVYVAVIEAHNEQAIIVIEKDIVTAGNVSNIYKKLSIIHFWTILHIIQLNFECDCQIELQIVASHFY